MAISCGGQSERIENFAVSPTRVQWYVAEGMGPASNLLRVQPSATY